MILSSNMGFENIVLFFQDSSVQNILAIIASGLVGSVVAIIVTSHYQRKNLEFNTLSRIFDILASESHREARECVFRAFEKYVSGSEPDLSIFESIENKTAIVRSDYDQIGIFIYKQVDRNDKGNTKTNWFKKGYIPEKVFFEAYAGSVVNSWTALEHFIEYQRGTTFSEKRFMLFFEHLAKKAKDFHSGKGESQIQKIKRENKTKLELWKQQIITMKEQKSKEENDTEN